MSSYTKVWTEEKIRSIIANLDRKTGLNGSKLPITFKCHGNRLGCYYHVEPKAFSFNRKFFNDSNTKEVEVIDVIRHEYAHYYVDAANLAKHIGHSRREKSHGADWRWACKMVGAYPTRLHNARMFKCMNWTQMEIMSAYEAKDVKEFDILKFIDRWKQTPVDNAVSNGVEEMLKRFSPDAYYEIGDAVLHPRSGFGVVDDVIVCNYMGHVCNYKGQKMFIRFEDRSTGVFEARDLCKMVNDVAIPYSVGCRCSKTT